MQYVLVTDHTNDRCVIAPVKDGEEVRDAYDRTVSEEGLSVK